VLSRILIVDDDAGTRDALADWLTAAGHQCVTAAAQDEALCLAGSRPPDAAIVAVDLEGADGIALARDLRSRTADVGVILLTGEPSFTGGVAAMRLGVNDYLLKPCGRDEILASVSRTLAWRAGVQRDRSGRELLQEAIGLACGRSSRPAPPRVSPAAGALLAVLRSRLPETWEHARRVARTAGSIAQALGLPDAQRADVIEAALLHDIGQMALPDQVLEMQGSRADAVAALRSHVEAGFDILSAVPSLQRLGATVLATEECFDGTGYPASLAGAEIPMGARIIAVANAHDRLWIGHRPGGADWADAVNAALVAAAGTQFDPDVVRAWLSVSEEVPCS